MKKLYIINTYQDLIHFVNNYSESMTDDIVLTHSNVVFNECKNRGFYTIHLPYRSLRLPGLILDVLFMSKILITVYFLRNSIREFFIFSHIGNEHFFILLRIYKKTPIHILRTVKFDRDQFLEQHGWRVKLRSLLFLKTVDFKIYGGSLITTLSKKIRLQGNVRIIDIVPSADPKIIDKQECKYSKLIFFMQPIYRTGKVHETVYFDFINNLIGFCLNENIKPVLKLHPRMENSELRDYPVLSKYVMDFEGPAEVLPADAYFVSISSQVIWNGVKKNRISLIDCLSFRCETVKADLKQHVVNNSDGNLKFARNFNEIIT